MFIPIINSRRDRSSKYFEDERFFPSPCSINRSTRLNEDQRDSSLPKSMCRAICVSSKRSHYTSGQNPIDDLLHNFSVYKFGKYENSLADVKHIDEDLVRSDRFYRCSPDEKYATKRLFFGKRLRDQSLQWKD